MGGWVASQVENIAKEMNYAHSPSTPGRRFVPVARKDCHPAHFMISESSHAVLGSDLQNCASRDRKCSLSL